MSLILDALKKADAERHAGKVHDILVKDAVQSTIPRSVASSGLPSGRWFKPSIFVGLAILVAGAFAWMLQPGRFLPTIDPLTSFSVATLAVPTVPTVPLVPTTLTVPPATHAIPAPAPETTNVAPPTPAVAITTSQLPVPPPIRQPTPAEVQAPAVKPLVRPGAVQPVETTPEQNQLPAMTLAQLPQQVRSEIPPLSISGSIYSTDPKERLLLVDKRMLHEGDEIAPGLILDSVLQKGALLRYKGYVFRVNN